MGNEQCCVTASRRDPSTFNLFCSTPQASQRSQHDNVEPLKPEIPQSSNNVAGQTTDSNTRFHLQLHTEYPDTVSVTHEEEMRALTSKRKKKLRRKKPPPLDNVDSPREYSEKTNTFFLTTNFEKAENYTDPSYKITTTQGDVVFDAQEGAFAKKLCTESWDNFEEDKNLSVRLSDKRLEEMHNLFQPNEYDVKQQTQSRFKPSMDPLKNAGIVRRIGEDENINTEAEDYEGIDKSHRDSIRNANQSQVVSPEAYEVIVMKDNYKSRLKNEDKTNSDPKKTGHFAGHIITELSKGQDIQYKEEEEEVVNYEPKQGLRYEDTDTPLVHFDSCSYQTNERKASRPNHGQLEGGKPSERVHTEETKRYLESRIRTLDDTSTTGKQNITNRHDLAQAPSPFNVLEGADETDQIMRNPGNAYSNSIVQYSQIESPQKDQTQEHSPGKSFITDQSLKRNEKQEENPFNSDKKASVLNNKVNNKISIEDLPGTFRNSVYVDPSPIEKRWDGDKSSFGSHLLETVSPLRERLVHQNDKSIDGIMQYKPESFGKEKEPASQFINHKESSSTYKGFEPGLQTFGYNSTKLHDIIEKEMPNENTRIGDYDSNFSLSKVPEETKKNKETEQWSSVQKDVKALLDGVFNKSRASILDGYLNQSKISTRTSGVYKPSEAWKQDLEKRSQYTNPFAGNNF